MIEEILTKLTHAIEGAPAVALSAAFVWGILSVLLSPCHLASIPLIVGFISRQGEMTTKRALATSTLFAVGILITIGALGVLTASVGQMIGDLGDYRYYVVAIVFFLAGLHLLDVIPMPWSGPSQVRMKRKGMLAALILGLVFGVALGPCTFSFMWPIIGFSIQIARTNFPYAVSLLVLYGVGHCAVIVFAGTCTELVQRYMNWTTKSKGTVIARRICGVLVLAAGIYMIYVAG